MRPGGSVEERISQLERGLADSDDLLDVFTRALLDTGEVTAPPGPFETRAASPAARQRRRH